MRTVSLRVRDRHLEPIVPVREQLRVPGVGGVETVETGLVRVVLPRVRRVDQISDGELVTVRGSSVFRKSTGACHGRTTLRPRRTRQRSIAGVTIDPDHGGGIGRGGLSHASTITSTDPRTSSGDTSFFPRKSWIPEIRGDVGSDHGPRPPGRSGFR